MQIVASLYMARSDVAYTVRTAAVHVWKTIVSNTPRTLAEILPALMRSIIESLASSGVPSPPAMLHERVCLHFVSTHCPPPSINRVAGVHLPDIKDVAGEERQQMAGRCLGELVRKMGERVLTHIIPILQKGMSSEDAATRQAIPPSCCQMPQLEGTPSMSNPPC